MKRKYLIILVMLLAIGFASVSTTLVLNGTLNIGKNDEDFDVYFSKTLEDGVENNKLVKDDTHIMFTKNMSLVKEKYILDYDVTNGSKNYDASITINCTESNEYVGVTNVFDTENILVATETRRGTLTIEVLKPYVGTEEEPTKDIEISCEIVAAAKERENLAEGIPADKVKQSSWTITDDNDTNGEVSIGDLITLGTESFYVYGVDGDNLKAISQYNLYVGNTVDQDYNITPLENPTGLQDSRSIGYKETDGGSEAFPFIGSVPFDDDSQIYAGSTIEEYVNTYASELAKLNGGENITTRLITLNELETMGCDSNTNSCDSVPAYITSTSYWTSSPYESNAGRVWSVDSRGLLSSYTFLNDSSFGVRPVIEISKSLFQ